MAGRRGSDAAQELALITGEDQHRVTMAAEKADFYAIVSKQHSRGSGDDGDQYNQEGSGSEDVPVFEQIGNVEQKIIFVGHAADEKAAKRFKETTELANKKDRQSVQLDTTVHVQSGRNRGRLMGIRSPDRRQMRSLSGSRLKGPTISSALSSGRTGAASTRSDLIERVKQQQLHPPQQFEPKPVVPMRRFDLTSGTGASASLKSALGIRPASSASSRRTQPRPPKRSRQSTPSASSVSSSGTPPEDATASTSSSSKQKNQGLRKEIGKLLDEISVKSLFEEEPRLRNIDYNIVESGADKLGRISSQEDYHASILDFERKYEDYCLLGKHIDSSKDLFVELHGIFSSDQASTEQKKLAEEKLKQLYKLRKDEMTKMTQKFNQLHAELPILKQRLIAYKEER